MCVCVGSRLRTAATFLGDERHLAGQLPLQRVPVVPLLHHLPLHLPHLELGRVHDVLQRRLTAVGERNSQRVQINLRWAEGFIVIVII